MPEVLTVPVELRWADTDQYGHVNNVAHVRYVEEARIRAFGLPDQPAGFHPDRPQPVLARLGPSSFTITAGQRFEYRQELEYHGQAVLAETWLSRIGSSSFDMDCRLVDVARTAEYLVSRVNLVLMDVATRRPRAITPPEREHLERYLAPGVAFR